MGPAHGATAGQNGADEGPGHASQSGSMHAAGASCGAAPARLARMQAPWSLWLAAHDKE
ncbi:protein of unknown function (plasmid) [Cupriavidus taiwanensis]|uniref:Uncharacterized protein n=1 Tax=Cupriavidus taiwanensis TaxID=164546 RepID=A0A7Z7JGN6_9BURK|nr:hypothetical protein CBM2585_B120009 [Cupriavidus taiwanensis]SOZ10667.1 protein of unknown function [Cupriavidus taiwanensis]SOZ12849.1 protein of unknown function [Cupriavidus taiwanensis]SOZ41344.1 protein of unknown function [Cupriavidus taiwanensis]SPC23674.1 protein of unknown function [Cupriavidus taiwanensis]